MKAVMKEEKEGGHNMYLTAEEQEMLDGKQGKGIQLAMEIVVKMGELYDAKRLIKVKRAHIDAAAYATIWDAGTDFVEFLVNHGAKVSVPTTINPTSRDIKDWEKMGLSRAFSDKCARLEKAYIDLGVIPTWTCAPYQCTNAPVFGEIVSWSESNAVAFVNSVLGARANRLPDLVDVCCAVIGRVPEYGLFLEENRAGELLFQLEGFDESWFRDSADYAVLGYIIGEIAGSRIPVVKGLPESTTVDQLKSVCAAAASSGSVALFHGVGITPEAPTLAKAFQNNTDYDTYPVNPALMRETRRKLCTAKDNQVNMVLLGCPFYSYDEVKEVASLMKGRNISPKVRFWIQVSQTVYNLAERSGIKDIIEASGIQFIKDTCVLVSDPDNDWQFTNVATNSGKVAQYIPGMVQTDVVILSTEECVEAAVSGRWF